jgi:hypothetical protein
VVPSGEVKAPAEAPVSKGPASAIVAALEKAEREGWNALSVAEKSVITRHDKNLADALRKR